jgi:3-oxoacyl-[acyl-carrier protein] reductase
MNNAFENQRIIIFGATGGIGSALARQLAAQGAQLTLVARDNPKLTALAAEVTADARTCDVTDGLAVETCVDDVVNQFGRINGVVNCVGSLLLKPAHLTTDAEWANVIAVNLTSSFHILRATTNVMMKTGGGSLVFMTSAVAQRGMINHEAIAAAKAGIVGLAQSAAATYARFNIRVNCVAPGLTRHEASLKASTALHPLGRIGEPEEVASAIRWFLDPMQQWVTVQVLAVDGGLSSVQAR